MIAVITVFPNGDFPKGPLEDTVAVLDPCVCKGFPNGEPVGFVVGANGFVVVVVVVVFTGAKGEALTSPNVDVVNGEVVVLDDPKVVPVFTTPNSEAEDVTVVPKVCPVFRPNGCLANGEAVVLVPSNCEAAVTNGALVVGAAVPNRVLVVGVTVPNGVAFGGGMCSVLWLVPKIFDDVGTVAAKVFVADWPTELKVGAVLFDPPKILLGIVDPPNAACSPNIGVGAFEKLAPPPNTGAPPNAGFDVWENIPELKFPAVTAVPKTEFVFCKAAAVVPNGFAVDVLVPPNIEVLD